jgi:hypothetical protein
MYEILYASKDKNWGVVFDVKVFPTTDLWIHRRLMVAMGVSKELYRRADNSRPMPITISAWEWFYATNLSRLQRETRERERDKQTAREKCTQRNNNSNPITSTSELLEAEQCHCACSAILGSSTCVWPLRNKDPPAKICRCTIRVQSGRLVKRRKLPCSLSLHFQGSGDVTIWVSLSPASAALLLGFLSDPWPLIPLPL